MAGGRLLMLPCLNDSAGMWSRTVWEVVFWDAEEMRIDTHSLALAEEWAQAVGWPDCPVCGGHTLVGHMTCGLAVLPNRS
jgi:hypothetical protein